MKMSKIIPLIFLLLLLAGVVLAGDGLYELAWWTVDGGGGRSSSAIYTVTGTIGQPEAGGFSGDGVYIVSGGFWGAAGAPAPSGDELFLPFLQRQ